MTTNDTSHHSSHQKLLGWVLALLSWQVQPSQLNLKDFISFPQPFMRPSGLSWALCRCDVTSSVSNILRHSSPQSRSISLCTRMRKEHISKQYLSYLNVYFIQSVKNINTKSTNISDQNLTEGSNILRSWLSFLFYYFQLKPVDVLVWQGRVILNLSINTANTQILGQTMSKDWDRGLLLLEVGAATCNLVNNYYY